VLTGDGGGGRARQGGARGVLTGARAAVERQHGRGEEWRRLELSVRAKEGARELGREGKKERSGPGVLIAFYSGRRSAGEGWSGW
jgi:hypothetical protein